MICYHHNDLDGKSAGFLVHKFKPEMIEDYPQNYISIGYNDKFNKHTLKDDVVITDISISESTYPQLLEVCKTARTVTWIDHHKTSLEVIDVHKDELQNITNLTYFVSSCACGALLTYLYFNLPKKELADIRKISDKEYYNISAEYNPEKDNISNIKAKVILTRFDKNNSSEAVVYNYNIDIPTWIAYVDDYDCWKKNFKYTDDIFLGTQCEDTDVIIKDDAKNIIFNPFWENLDKNNISELDKLYTMGTTVNKYLGRRYNSELSDTFEWTYNGIKFLCKNGTGNSWNFGAMIDKYTAVILFNYSGASGKWDYSVYASDNSTFDCSEFCKQFGGGGHFHSAGFSTEYLIFTDRRDILANTVYLGGISNEDYRNEFARFLKEHSLTKIKKINSMSPVESYKERVKTPKVDLFVINTKDYIHDDKLVNKIYNKILELIENKHGKIFLAIIENELDDNNEIIHYDDERIKLTEKDPTRISITTVIRMVLANNGIFRTYSGEDAIKSLVNHVAYII